jgi:hypothetical protein
MNMQGSRRKRGIAQHQAIVLAAQQAAQMRSENRGRRRQLGFQSVRLESAAGLDAANSSIFDTPPQNGDASVGTDAMLYLCPD